MNIDIETLKIVFNGMTFSQRQGEKIVGGRDRFIELVASGRIRKDENDNKRWHCNAWDCIKYMRISYYGCGKGARKRRVTANRIP